MIRFAVRSEIFPGSNSRAPHLAASSKAVLISIWSQPTAGPEIGHFDVFFDGKMLTRINKAQKIRVETDALNDGYHELRVAATSNTLVASRKSERLDFILNRQGQSVRIEIAEKQVRMGQPLLVTATANAGEAIEIWQNSRVVGKITDNQVSIDSAVLGQGKSKLQAVAVGSRTIKSVPIEVEVLNDAEYLQAIEQHPQPKRSPASATKSGTGPAN